MVPVAVSMARWSPLPRCTVAPVGMAGSTETVEVSTPRSRRASSDGVAEHVVTDDAAVGHAQAQPRQATGGDRRRAADGQADGADVLLDLPELGHDVVADDEDVRIDVTDDVDVGVPLRAASVTDSSPG